MSRYPDYAGLDEKKNALAFAMAEGMSVCKAAESIGISERSGFLWLAIDPKLRERVQQFQAVLFSTALNKLARLGGKAVDTLEQILDDPATSPKIRFETALAILEQGSKLRERITLDERLSRLEEKVQESTSMDDLDKMEGIIEERKAVA